MMGFTRECEECGESKGFIEKVNGGEQCEQCGKLFFGIDEINELNNLYFKTYGECGKTLSQEAPGYNANRLDCSGPECQLWIEDEIYGVKGWCSEKAVALALIDLSRNGLVCITKKQLR
jgi:hypothetical protein